jgi:hypothetical protein
MCCVSAKPLKKKVKTCQNEGTCVVEAGLAICYCRGDYSGATCAGEYYIRLKNL